MALELPGERKESRLPWVFGLILLAMLGAVLVYSYRTDIRLEDVLGNIAKKNDLVSRMNTDLLKSVEAEKNAVLADTDEESLDFARQSRDASDAVEADRVELSKLIEAGRSGEEEKLLGEFNSCWDEFRKIDQELLNFAVLNTNLKAAALSFGKGREAVKRFEKNLAELIDRESSTPAGQQVSRLAYAALADAFNIYSLESPHIIASRDEQMDSMEAEMNHAAERIKGCFNDLAKIVKDGSKQQLAAAEAAFKDFLLINSEVLKLSRQNTNVKSMELSLGAKRKVTAQCREALNALQNSIRSRSFRATR